MIDHETVLYVFRRLNKCLESGGTINWARVGQVIVDSQEEMLKEIMSNPDVKYKIRQMASEKEVSIEMATTLFEGTVRQIVEDKDTDWSKFTVEKL